MLLEQLCLTQREEEKANLAGPALKDQMGFLIKENMFFFNKEKKKGGGGSAKYNYTHTHTNDIFSDILTEHLKDFFSALCICCLRYSHITTEHRLVT